MKLYLLRQNDNYKYNTYDSCLVCAENEADAKTITPDGDVFKEDEMFSSWAMKASAISCEEIGEANKKQKRGIIIASLKVE